MRRRQIEQIRRELRELIVKQTEALKAQTFGGLTDKEIGEYDRRQQRIHELCANLSGAMEEDSHRKWDSMSHPWLRKAS